MQGVNPGSNWCCWPFSLCCGQTDGAETEPLNRDPYVPPRLTSQPLSIEGAEIPDNRSDGIKTPGTTPTKSHIVQEQRMEEQPDYV